MPPFLTQRFTVQPQDFNGDLAHPLSIARKGDLLPKPDEMFGLLLSWVDEQRPLSGKIIAMTTCAATWVRQRKEVLLALLVADLAQEKKEVAPLVSQPIVPRFVKFVFAQFAGSRL